MQRHTLAGLAIVVVLVAILEAAVAGGLISRFLVARPSQVASALATMLREEGLVRAFLVTLGSAFAATAAGAVVGVPLGYLLHRHRLMGEAYGTFVAGLFSAPLILLYPLFLVLFGRTVTTTIVISAITAAIPIILGTRQALDGVKPVFLKVGTVLNMSQRQIFALVMLPAALPTIFTGLRLALIYAMISVVAVEYLVGFGGLGAVVGEMYDRYNIPGMYAAIVAVIVVSIVFFTFTDRAERWLKSL